MRRLFVRLNNLWVRFRVRKLAPEQVLMLAPRCLQNSACRARVAVDPGECRRCGRCGVGDLVGLSLRYGVPLVVATGGGIALDELARPEIKGVVAIACGNELFAGMLKKKGKPALGIEISRPHGPCRDTVVEPLEVENGIRVFLGLSELENPASSTETPARSKR